VLRERGHVEGRNLTVERRFAAGRTELVRSMAADLVQSGVDVIVATGLRENQAAREATRTIPIVMVVVDDPVATGLVESLARPGGNITGLAFNASGLGGKWVELLKQAVPGITRMGVVGSRPLTADLQKEMQDAGRALNVTLAPLIMVRGPDGFEPAFVAAKRDGVGGLIFPNDALTVLHRELVVRLTIKHRLPAIFAQDEPAASGALMTYGPSFTERFRRAALFVDKILRGAKPADLPVEQPTTFELALNQKTARAIGLTFPPALVARADRVIEP
jgi:putative tryptophan/tyrosine transport system substrate-binding protein